MLRWLNVATFLGPHLGASGELPPPVEDEHARSDSDSQNEKTEIDVPHGVTPPKGGSELAARTAATLGSIAPLVDGGETAAGGDACR
jgi:hypothetical protein